MRSSSRSFATAWAASAARTSPASCAVSLRAWSVSSPSRASAFTSSARLASRSVHARVLQVGERLGVALLLLPDELLQSAEPLPEDVPLRARCAGLAGLLAAPLDRRRALLLHLLEPELAPAFAGDGGGEDPAVLVALLPGLARLGDGALRRASLSLEAIDETGDVIFPLGQLGEPRGIPERAPETSDRDAPERVSFGWSR